MRFVYDRCGDILWTTQFSLTLKLDLPICRYAMLPKFLSRSQTICVSVQLQLLLWLQLHLSSSQLLSDTIAAQTGLWALIHYYVPFVLKPWHSNHFPLYVVPGDLTIPFCSFNSAYNSVTCPFLKDIPLTHWPLFCFLQLARLIQDGK